MGTLNQLRCSVVDAAQGTLRYDGQVFHTASPVRGRDGDQVTVMLRPEELRFGVAEGENQLSGTVESVMFLGAIVRMRMRLGESTVIIDNLNERTLSLPSPGNRETVSFPRHACWVMVEA